MCWCASKFNRRMGVVIMIEFLTVLLMGSCGFMVVASFVGYKLLSLPLVTNIIYLKLGGQVASDIVSDVADAVVAVKSTDTVQQDIITILTQYNLIPVTAVEPALIEEVISE